MKKQGIIHFLLVWLKRANIFRPLQIRFHNKNNHENHYS